MFDNKTEKQLLEDWKGMLDLDGLPSITDPTRRRVTARLLENQKNWIQGDAEDNRLDEASSAPTNVNANVAKYDPVLIAMARRSVPNLIAYDMCGVQPMSGPSGLVFSLRPKYVRDGQLAEEAFYNEPDIGHSGDKSATQGESPAALNDQPSPGAYTTGRGMSTEAAELLGTTKGDPWEEMGFEVDQFQIYAKSRKLKAEWSNELAQDMRKIHGISAQTELANILSSQIIADINREVIRSIYITAKPGAMNNDIANAGVYDLKVDADGRWAGERYAGLIFQIGRDANVIARQTRMGKGNFILCNSDVADALSMSGQLLHNDNTGQLDVDDAGNTYAGRLRNGMKVFVDPFHEGPNFYVVGYKGSSSYDAGMYYCPYVPLQFHQTIGEDSFQPRMGFATRYALAANPFAEGENLGNGKLNPNSNVYFRRVRVNNIAGAQ